MKRLPYKKNCGRHQKELEGWLVGDYVYKIHCQRQGKDEAKNTKQEFDDGY